MDAPKARQMIEIATDEWTETWGSDFADENRERVSDMLDRAHGCLERADWTGAWLWAGNALGFIRERLAARLTGPASTA